MIHLGESSRVLNQLQQVSTCDRDFGLKPHGGIAYACRIKEFTHFTLVAEPVVSTTRLPLSRYIRNHSIFISVASALALVPPAVTPFSVSRPGKPAQSVGCKIHGSSQGVSLPHPG